MLTQTSDPTAVVAVARAREHGHRTMRLHTAARRVETLHPGPVGALCARELRAYAEFGVATGHDAVLLALADHILAAPPPPVRLRPPSVVSTTPATT